MGRALDLSATHRVIIEASLNYCDEANRWETITINRVCWSERASSQARIVSRIVFNCEKRRPTLFIMREFLES